MQLKAPELPPSSRLFHEHLRSISTKLAGYVQYLLERLMEYTFNLGNYSRPVDTDSREAQVWFDRGLIWAYAFNHEEAKLCFEKAIVADPECGMAYWGRAYSVGPNYNFPWEAFDSDMLKDNRNEALTTLHLANKVEKIAFSDIDGVESRLLVAIKSRFCVDYWTEKTARWNDEYADKMQELYEKHPHDLDVAALYAE